MALSDYRTAVVTGASKGIGAELVRRLRERGLAVHALARSGDKLAALAAETGCVAHALDIADGDAVANALGALEVDVLVNNAGLAAGGAAFETPEAEWEALLAVNLRGLANCLRVCVPGMTARDRGHVVNLGSMAGLREIPGMPAYAATKAAVHSLSQNLRLDLYGTRVRVTEVCPGRVKTGIHAANVGGDLAQAEELFYRGRECLEPGDVAEVIVYALEAPAHVDLTLIEIMPTHQVMGGHQFHRTDE
jgi:NADP-dependent 3-hydroxy acid dehydrogenase YdfG